MCTAGELVERKGSFVAWLPPQATVLHAARLMNEWHIGSVLVMENDRLVGIFTERDVLRRVVAAHLDPHSTSLADVMTSPVACAAPHTLTDELRLAMRFKRIRHIPVVEDDRVVGIVSIGDLNKVEQDVQEQTIQYLEQYMSVM